MNQNSFDFDKLASHALRLDGSASNPNLSIKIDGITGHRDPLTEAQQRIVTAAISLIHAAAENAPSRTVYSMKIDSFLSAFPLDADNLYIALTGEIEKMLKKGVWLFEESQKSLIRANWFQAIEFRGDEIVFQFTEKILPLIFKFALDDAEYNLVKGIQYKGKHTLAVFNIIWACRNMGVVEFSIPQLMQQLSLEHTRYSYGQLKLRVLEPSFEEIYGWDDTIFVRFGPTFSGRRVEGVWLEVVIGDKARELRKVEPEFKIALPEHKPTA